MSRKSTFKLDMLLLAVLVFSFVLCQSSAANPHRLNPKKFGELRTFEAQFADKEFDYTMAAPLKDVCGAEGGVKVLIMVTSGPDNFDKRKAMRESWVYDKSNPSKYLILFLIGQSADATINAAISEEQHQYEDIVRYSATEEYDMLSLKTHAALTWKREFCPTADYILKTDDDSVIFLERFDHFVQTRFDQTVKKRPSSIFCNLYKGLNPIRSTLSKYYVSEEEYSGDRFPDFCQGSSYLVSSQAASDLLDHTKNVKFLHLEDVLFTGVVAINSKVRRYGSPVFGYMWERQGLPTRDADHVPYLSGNVGLQASKIGKAYERLKELDPDDWSTRVRYDYHYRLLDF